MGTRHTTFFMDKEYPNIAGGGGAGGSFEAEVIYQNSGSSIPSSITLEKGISNYDAIMLSGYRQQYPSYWTSSIYLTEECVTNRIINIVDDAMYAWYTVTDDTTLTNAGANIVVDKVYGLKFGGGGLSPTPTEEGIILFDGAWKNQDIMAITPYLATIENGKLHCQGTHCGVVVSDVSGLTMNVGYSLIIEVESTNGFSYQAGQCSPTANLNDIIQYGTNRYTYNDASVGAGSYVFKIKTQYASRGVFLGGAYTVSTTDYYIKKITLKYDNEREYT